jgi:DNA modification methylase
MLDRPARTLAERRRGGDRTAQAGEAVRLGWPGRTWKPGDGLGRPGPRLVDVEQGSESPAPVAAPARLVAGDALDVARALASEGLTGQVDLVYVDPPFGSQTAYVHEARLDGPADGRVVRTQAYDDRWDQSLAAYLDMLAPRLDALAHLLAPGATLWVHVDWRASYLVRLLLDEILGREAFVNEIVWRRAPNLGRQAASHQFGRTLDTLVIYGKPGGPAGARLVPPTRLEPIEAKAVRIDAEGRPFTAAPRGDYTDESIARLEKEGRVHRTATGKVYIKYFLVKDAAGEQWCRERRVDSLWTDVPPLRHARPGERTGFPTQKPRALLDRVVACASPPGGLVVDVFAGSGTTGESAHALGRRFVLGDASPLALATARARLLRAGVPLALQSCQMGRGAGEVSDARVKVHVAREGEGATVTLEEPREPLAWAIDDAVVEAAPFDDAVVEAAPFRRAWHSERAPGIKPAPAARVARLAHAGGTLGIWVWLDDGRIVRRTVDVP